MIRIVIADDQQSIRSALQSQLKPFADIEIVGIAENGRKAVEQTAQWQPDVLLLDLEMPVLDGLDAAHEIKERSPKVKILVFTAQNDPTCLLPALRAGAHGYLLKGTPAEDLANAIRSVQKGHFQVGPGILEPTSNAVTEKSVASASALGDTIAIAPAETRLQKSMLNSGGLVKAESSA
jgi:hemolysin D